MSASIHFHCKLSDYLYQWDLKIIRLNGLFYVIQHRSGATKRLLNGGNINTAWSIVQSVLAEPFQTAVLIQHLNIKLTDNSLTRAVNEQSIDTFVVVGIHRGSYSLAKVEGDDFAAATIEKGTYSSAITSLRLFDKVVVNKKNFVIISKLQQ